MSATKEKSSESFSKQEKKIEKQQSIFKREQENNVTSVVSSKSQRSVHSVKPIATLPGHQVNKDGIGAPRFVNRVLENIYSKSLADISVNPFVNLWQASRWEKLSLVTFGPLYLLMIIIRTVPMLFCLLLACVLAKVAVLIIEALNRKRINSEPFREFVRDVCFAVLRSGLFFAGFYWIRVIDYRRDKLRFAPIISVAPHTSFFDVLIILKLKRPTFVSKAENQQVPLIGNILRLCKGIYVNRDDKNSRQKTIEEIRARANAGETILIFPEGTTANRTSLLQFKLGAFYPGLSIQPIMTRWDAGETMDSVAWAWEGPGTFSLMISLLTRVSTNLEITVLPEYTPTVEEKANTHFFAENVSKLMCQDLGVLQSYYSFDDALLMPAAKDIRLFRSPACISLLKLCTKLFPVKKTEKEKKVKAGQVSPKSGEDIDHAHTTVELYRPKNYYQPSSKNLQILLKREQFIKCRWDKPLNITKPKQQICKEEFQLLPISGARRLFTDDNLPLLLDSNKNRSVYSTFSHFLEHCLTHLETHFEYQAIESSEDLVGLLDLKRYLRDQQDSSFLVDSALARLSPLFADLLKIIEHSVNDGPVTTAHLLIVLHLCDIRENDLWARLHSAVTIFDMMRTASASTFSAEMVSRKQPVVNLQQLRTLLWYSLGLQDFNDQFFVDRYFDVPYLRANLGRTFYRAVVENGSQLLE